MTGSVLKGAAHSGVGTLALATSEAVFEETRLEQGFQHTDQRVVNHPVTKWRGGDHPFLGFVDLEIPVWARLVATILQPFGEIHGFEFPLGEESGGGGEAAAATHREIRRLHQVAKADDFLPEVLMGLGHAATAP